MSSDVYRMDEVYDVVSDASSSGDELVEEDDDLIDLNANAQQHLHPQTVYSNTTSQHHSLSQAHHHHRPPPISTEWEQSMDEHDDGGGTFGFGQEATLDSTRVSFNLPMNDSSNENDRPTIKIRTVDETPESSSIYAENTNQHTTDFSSPYPTQSARRSTRGRSAADTALDQIVTGQSHSGGNQDVASSLAEVTPAFLRRAAQELGINASTIDATKNDRGILSNQPEFVPSQNLLVNRKNKSVVPNNSKSNHIAPDSSFYGADASALNGTFVSIRDLSDDDDVPSVDNIQSNIPITRKERGSNIDIPTEESSLLGKEKRMPWQGGFFGSQMEKEDRKERMKMKFARNKGIIASGIRTFRSYWRGQQTFDRYHAANGRGTPWEVTHPIETNFMSHAVFHAGDDNGSLSRRFKFSRFVIGALCLHLFLCGLHDLFLRYIAYRNPLGEGESDVSWNGEGRYIPPYWISFEGRVFNPCIGPGARTLTLFGAIIPGLVISKSQGWRIITSPLQTSSAVQLILHVWSLTSVVGGSMTSLEWRRGAYMVCIIFIFSSIIGVVWSITLEPGRLITASEMGIVGLLAAAAVDYVCFPQASKEDDNDVGTRNPHTGINGSNVVSASSDEQFSFLPPTSQKEKHRNNFLVSRGNPSLLLVLELLASWWATYTSLPGTALSVVAGVTCALLLFVGNPPSSSRDKMIHHDLLFSETLPPPPPPPLHWRDDDDSADTSVDAGRQVYNTPLMRRSILGDEEDDEELYASSSVLRKRHGNGSSMMTPSGRESSALNLQQSSSSRIIARVVGLIFGLVLIVIPASLIATGGKPSNEITRASILGCRPMRILYEEDNINTASEKNYRCAGGCIPLSREQYAKRVEGLRSGRCDALGYRCWYQSGTMTLQHYKVNVGIFVVPSADGCSSKENDDGQEYNNNDYVNNELADAANNGDVEGVQ